MSEISEAMKKNLKAEIVEGLTNPLIITGFDKAEKEIEGIVEKEKMEGEKKQDDDGRLYYEEGRRQFRNQQLYPVLSELDEEIMA